MVTCDDCGLPIEGDKTRRGDGAKRLCEPCATLANCNRPIRVSPLERDDLELILAWRSNPEIYRHFRLQDGPLDWDEHVDWFRSRASNRYDFVIHYDGRRVGSISIDSDDEVGIFLGDFSAHGHGVATTALDWLCERFRDRTPLTAEIHAENESSKQLFTQCGFQRTENGGNDTWIQYSYDP